MNGARRKRPIFDKREAVEEIERVGFLDEHDGYGNAVGGVEQAFK